MWSITNNLNVKVWLLNLNHVKYANAILSIDIIKLELDIVRLNEFYFQESIVTGFQRNMKVIAANNNKREDITLNNPELKVNVILIHRSIIVCSTNWDELTCFVTCIYYLPQCPSLNTMPLYMPTLTVRGRTK